MADAGMNSKPQGMDMGDKLRGPLSIAMVEVEKITDILQQGNLSRNGISADDLSGDESSWLSRRGNTAQDELLSCLMVMKKLMEEAETENMRLKEDKKLLTRKIGESLSSVNKEMESLRVQLKHQDRRLNELSPNRSKTNIEENSLEYGTPMSENKQAMAASDDPADERIKELNTMVKDLEADRKSLADEVECLRGENGTCGQCADLQATVDQLQKDLLKSREGHLIARKERKQLKTDKLELLNQMKQLYSTIEDKEKELRDFILNYEQRMKDSEEAIRELVAEKEKVQKDRWEILKHARESAERCVELKTKVDELGTELTTKEKRLHSALKELRQLKGVCPDETTSSALPTSDSGDDNRTENSSEKQLTPGKVSSDDDCISTGESVESQSNRNSMASELSVNMAGSNGESPMPSPGIHTQYLSLGYPEAFDLSKVTSRRHSISGAERRPRSYLAAQMSYHNVPPVTPSTEVVEVMSPGRGRRTLSETLSRIFNRDKERESMDASSPRTHKAELDRWFNADDETGDKWQTWDAMQDVPMGHWSARAVLVWLEIDCCMGAYVQKCAENIRTGKMLLELSHQQVVAVLGIVNPMHKLKLKLAIEEHRTPRTKKPHVAKLDHMWVSGTWLRDLGLSQYSQVFETNLIDGRMLNAIGKKDLEKHCQMTKKFHQTSFFRGVELLRMLHFNKESLYVRRSNSLDTNIDVLVWTNERIAKWLERHDLKEFADKMPESGIHGALMVIEKHFTADSLTHALSMQGNKELSNRLAGSELTLLLKVERTRLPPSFTRKNKKPSLTRSLSWRFSRRNSEEQLNKSKSGSKDVISFSLPKTTRSQDKESKKEMSASNGKITSI